MVSGDVIAQRGRRHCECRRLSLLHHDYTRGKARCSAGRLYRQVCGQPLLRRYNKSSMEAERPKPGVPFTPAGGSFLYPLLSQEYYESGKRLQNDYAVKAMKEGAEISNDSFAK